MNFKKPNTVKLEDAVISSNTGADAIKRAPIVEEDTGIRCLRIGDVSNNRPFTEWGFTNANEKVVDKFRLKKDDIVIARTGNTIGVVKYIEKDVLSVYNNGLIRLKIDKTQYDAKYIYYNLMSQSFKEFVYSISGGTSTQPNMKINHTLKYEISKFVLKEQKYIAEILSSLDEKIHINNEINKTLEAMVQEIFKYWFIDFEFQNDQELPYKSSGGEMVDSDLGMIPKGWKVDNIGNSASLVTRGVSPKYADVSEQYVINQKCIRNGSLSTVLSRPHNSIVSKEKKLQFGDILINSTGVGTLGRVAQVYENLANFTVDSHVTIVRPNDTNRISYMGCLLKNMQTKFENAGTGTTGQTELNREAIKQMQILMPNDNVLEKFSHIYDPIYTKIVQRQRENFLLANLRDTLIPKLMSGEIRVSLNDDDDVS